MVRKFRVCFFLRKDRKTESGEVPIYVRIYLANERVTIGTTKCYINPSLWDNASGAALGRSGKALCINNALQRIEEDLLLLYRRYEFREDISLENIKNDYLGKGSKDCSQSFIQFYDAYEAKVESEVGSTRSKASLQKYRVAGKHFKNFLKSRLKKNDLKMQEFNDDVVMEFFEYMLQDAHLSHNTGLKMIQNIRAVTRYAIRKGILSRDPFADFKFRYKQKDRGFLTDHELNLMMKHHFSTERLELVRDVFIFSCFTGLAYIDVSQLRAEHLVTIGGVEWIMKPREKTDVPSRIPLLEIPKKILLKYAGKGKDGRLLPIISNQKFNEYLKEIAGICGIDKNLTFHLARHTFATLALSKGVPVETVSKMLGHTNIKTTQIYAKMTYKKIESDMAALAAQLQGFTLEGDTNTPTANHSQTSLPEIAPIPENQEQTSVKKSKKTSKAKSGKSKKETKAKSVDSQKIRKGKKK